MRSTSEPLVRVHRTAEFRAIAGYAVNVDVSAASLCGPDFPFLSTSSQSLARSAWLRRQQDGLRALTAWRQRLLSTQHAHGGFHDGRDPHGKQALDESDDVNDECWLPASDRQMAAIRETDDVGVRVSSLRSARSKLLPRPIHDIKRRRSLDNEAFRGATTGA
nr:hypothetical protein CFP56_21158 [Quercus suber]